MKTVALFCLFLFAPLVLFAGDRAGPSPFPLAPLSPAAFVNSMGIGINLGNTFDSFYNGPSKADETGWGNPVVTREYIHAIAQAGFKTMRFPVTWTDWLGSAPEYRIDEKRLSRIAEVVDWCLDEGLFVILNMHHDGGHGQDCWIGNAEIDSEGTIAKYVAVWKQIAARFKDYGDRLILESMNEVGFEQISLDDAYALLNRMNQSFVDTVRASGGANASRYLLIAGYWTDIAMSADSRYILPRDGAARLILSVHYYTPSSFAIADRKASWGYRETWGTEADRAELSQKFDILREHFTSKGIPVIVGEYGANPKDKDAKSRLLWLGSVARASRAIGACPVLWDTGYEMRRSRPFDFKDPAIGALFRELSGGGSGA